MALDKNYFDDKLKEKPWRDLDFRALVWFCISGLAAYFALRGGITPLSFLERTAKSIAPIANFVGAFAVWLVLPALALKDLEFFSPDKWGQVSRRGRLGHGTQQRRERAQSPEKQITRESSHDSADGPKSQISPGLLFQLVVEIVLV